MKKNIFIGFQILILFISTNTLVAQSKHYSPVEYVENKGQWEGDFLFKGTTPKGDIYIKKNGFRILLSDETNHDKIDGYKHGVYTEPQKLNYHAFDMIFENSNLNSIFSTEKSQKHYYNYFLGNNSDKWKSGIHPVLNVNSKEIYNNIDLHIYSDEGNVKYDIIVKPNGNYKDIQIQYEGLNSLKIEKNKLLLNTSLGNVQENIPFCYQYIDGERKIIPCHYVLKNNTVSFEVGKEYDKNNELYIDPVLIFCSFTGSVADNWGYTATYDSSGNFYAGGIASGMGYPVTTGVIQPTYGGGSTIVGNFYPCDASFTKFNATGSTVIFATYLGGSSNDQPHSIIVDNNDQLCIAGRTYSNNFPTTTGCYDNSYNGGADMFVAKFNNTGTVLIGSTYIGGTNDDGVNEEAQEFLAGVLKHNYADDARSEIIFDNTNNVYVASCTKSSDFPVTANAFQNTFGGAQDAVIIELNNNLSSLIWSTFSGGTNNDAAYVLNINQTNPNELFVGGGTMSSNYPSTANSLQANFQGGTVDGFLMKFNNASKALIASTFIGTNQYDQVYGVQTDIYNNVFIMGQTLGAYPVTSGVYSVPNSSQFVSKINNNLTSILASTVYGTGTTSTTNISPNAFLVDKCQNVYVSGWGGNIGNPFTSSSTIGMPTTANALQPTTDGNDFYFIVFDQDLTGLLYGSFFGQNGGVSEHVDGGTSRFDSKGVIYQAICSACGGSQIFPTTAGAAYTQNLGPNCNLAALKIDFQLQNPIAFASINGDSVGCAPFTVQFQNNSTSATGYVWDFGDGSPTTTATNPSHTYTTPGTYFVHLIANNPNGCTASADTTIMKITVKADTIHAAFTFTKKDSCNPFTANFTNTSSTNLSSTPTYVWNFGDGSTNYTGQTPPLHTFPSSTSYTVTLTMTDTNACNSPSVITAVVNFSTSFVTALFKVPDSICMPALINFNDLSTSATTWNWNFGDGNNSTVAQPSNDYTTPGTYNVVLIVGNPETCNKFDTASKSITVFSSPIADFTWMPNPPTPNTPNVFTNFSTGATHYLWNFGDGGSSTDKNPTYIFQKDGTYDVCLTAFNEVGCKDTICKKVRGVVVPLADVPSGFSPNGDNVNDFVYVKGYGIEKMTFRIFNRWGEKVFETSDKNVGWDGRYKGIMQEMEAYQYTLSVTFFDGTSSFKKGSITLLK